MKEDIALILRVQELDLEMIALKEDVLSFPSQIETLEQDKNNYLSGFKEFEEKLKKQKLKLKEMEGLIETEKTRHQKYQMQLNAIKTNHEYSSMLKEIETVHQCINGLEDKLLVIMEEIENFDHDKQKKKMEIDENVKAIDQRISELVQKSDDINKNIKELEEKRIVLASGCEGSLFKKYEKYINKKHSVALVTVEENGSCSGCHHNLPPNIRNEVLKGKIIQCDNCVRLLFWKKPEKQESEEEAEKILS